MSERVQMSEPVQSAAAGRGPLALAATGLRKDFRLGRGTVLHAVRDVSFGLYAGAVVALVGESGSGKSTVAKLIAGQERPTAGVIALAGHPAGIGGAGGFRRYKSQVQYVFQDPFASLNPVHTVAYHLQRPVRLHQGRAADAHETVAALLEQVRLTPPEQFAAKYPHELSGGQRQRVSFARALAARPRVLLADEPVSMLDVSIRLEMLNLLDDLRDRLSLALLYITHDIASARYFADEVLVMYGGQIVERGPAEEVTQQPAHPYTQLLVASAPDPDDLGSILRTSPAHPGADNSNKRAAARHGAAPNSAAPHGAAPHGAAPHGAAPHGAATYAAAPRAGAGSGPAAQGCPFSTRCPLVIDKCRTDNPAPQRVTALRAAACWRLSEAAPALAASHRNTETEKESQC